MRNKITEQDISKFMDFKNLIKVLVFSATIIAQIKKTSLRELKDIWMGIFPATLFRNNPNKTLGASSF